MLSGADIDALLLDWFLICGRAAIAIILGFCTVAIVGGVCITAVDVWRFIRGRR